MSAQREKVAIALGANLGDRLRALEQAAARLAEDLFDGSDEVRVSSVYETTPWGIADQPAFLNAVIVGLSEWKPPAIVTFLKSIEREMGRQEGPRNGPRAIDCDLIAWGNHTWASDGVTVPHPRWRERDFVILPLREAWPDWTPPGEATPVAKMAVPPSPGPAARAIGPLRLDRASP